MFESEAGSFGASAAVDVVEISSPVARVREGVLLVDMGEIVAVVLEGFSPLRRSIKLCLNCSSDNPLLRWRTSRPFLIAKIVGEEDIGQTAERY
jgi:hypothetical protein